VTQQLGFHVPATAFPDEGEGEQLAIAAGGGLGARTVQERRQVLADLIHNAVDLIAIYDCYNRTKMAKGSSLPFDHLRIVEDKMRRQSNNIRVSWWRNYPRTA
jgi:hypothetical protein